MRAFSEMDQARVGAVGLVAVVVLLAGLLNIGALRTAFAGTGYSAAFTEAGGLRAGDEVRISGLRVGTVTAVELDGAQVAASFDLADTTVPLGDTTRAAIRTANALGTRFLELQPRGTGELASGGRIPVERTDAPYSLVAALGDLTTTTSAIDTAQLAASFDTLADTFATTPPSLAATLDGVERLSLAIASRDQALRQVLTRAGSVNEVLAQRSANVVTLLADGSALLDELEQRRRTIRELLVTTRTATEQLSGLVADNRETLRPALEELRRTLDVLNRNEDNLRVLVQRLGPFARSLGESLAGGPFFYAYLQNLVPTNLVPVLPELLGDAPLTSPRLPSPDLGGPR